jgi:hypothetical protein
MTAAREYKDVIAAVTAGLDAESERNTQRVAELRRIVDERSRLLDEAADRHILIRIGAELAWEEALKALWVESWMDMRPYPRPDRLAKPGDLAALAVRVEEAAAALRAEVQKRRIRMPGS